MMKHLVLVLGFAGCYSPEIGDCQYLCDFEASDPSKVCPKDMFCSADNFCVSDPTFNCGVEPLDDSGVPPPDEIGPMIDSFMGMDSSVPDGGGPVDAAADAAASDPTALEADLTSVREQLDDVSVAP